MRKIKPNNNLKNALKIYIKKNNLTHADYIFKSRKGLNEPITVMQAYKALKIAAVTIGIAAILEHIH